MAWVRLQEATPWISPGGKYSVTEETLKSKCNWDFCILRKIICFNIFLNKKNSLIKSYQNDSLTLR